MDDSVNASSTTKILAALFYAISSFSIVMVNKNILTNYQFPSVQFLGVGQMMAAVIILRFGKFMNLISFPDFTSQTTKKIFPLPLIYIGNLIAGLGGTKMLSLPMFTVLRRFSILFTMILELLILRKSASRMVVITVLTMIAGALIAASDDLSFDAMGYMYIFMNDIFTALNAVIMKKQLNAQDLGKYGITYYNCLLMVLPAIGITYMTGDLEKVPQFESWNNPNFLFQFFLSCVMGFVLMYSIAVCTAYNSALTTTVVGCLKNILVTYIGMVFGGDYKFSWINFVGVNLSVVGSVVYSYYSFTERSSNKKTQSSTLENVKVQSPAPKSHKSKAA